MKKLLLLVSAVVLALGLTACKPGDETGLTAIVLSGIADKEVTVGDAFNALTGITALGDDDVDYSEFITADSETCVISSSGIVDTLTAKTCVIEFTAVAGGKFVRASMTLTIKNVVVVVDDNAPTVIEWDFEDDSDLVGWEIYAANGGALAISIDNGAMKMVTEAGGQRHETRLDFMGVPLEAGADYKVSFKMKSDIADKKIHVNFGELLPPPTYFAPFKTEGVDIFTLTTDWVEYSFTFHMDDANGNGGPLFEMGNVEGSVDIDATIWMDDLKIEGGTGTDNTKPAFAGVDDVIIDLDQAFDVNTGVTANDFVDGDVTSLIVVSGDTLDVTTVGDYTITYTVTDAALNVATVNRVISVVDFVVDTKNSAVSDAFDTDMTITNVETADWYTTVTWGFPIFTAEFASGKLIMSSAKDGDKDFGTDFFNHIVRFTEMKFVEDVQYKIVFDAMTDELDNTTNNIMFKVESSDFFSETQLLVPSTSGTFEYAFTYDGSTTTEGSVLFFVGGREQVITVENLMVYISSTGASADSAPVITGAMDASVLKDSTVDLLDGVTASDIEDGALTLTAANVTVVGPNAETTFDSAVAGAWTVTYSVTDTGINTTTKEITITVVDVGTNVLGSWSFATASEVDDWTFDGTTLAFDVDALKVSYTSGSNAWEPRLVIQGVPFEKDYTYMISFKAKSSVAGKKLHLQVGEILSANPWFTNFKPDTQAEYVVLGTTWTEYYFIFNMTIDNMDGGVLFEMGNMADSMNISGDIWFDDIMIYGGSGADLAKPVLAGVEDVTIELGDTFVATAGVTAIDYVDGDLTSTIAITGDTVDVNTYGEYTVTYTVTDAAGNIATVNRVVTVAGFITDVNNAGVQEIFTTDTVLDFTATNDWYLNNDNAPSFTASTTGGVLTVVHVKDGDAALGTDLWNSIFRYQKLVLVQGAQYKIVFDGTTNVASNTAQNLLLKIEGGGAFTEKRFVMVDTADTYEFKFTWNGATTIDGLLLFMIGGTEHTLTFENLDIMINNSDALIENAPIFSGVSNKLYASGATVDLLDGVSAFDVEDGVYTLDSTNYSVVGPNAETTFDGSDGLWTVTYTVTDADLNETSKEVEILIADTEATTILANPAFAVDLAGWTKTGLATDLTIAYNEASLHYTAKGSNPWDVKAEAQGLVFENGATYAISFSVRSDEERLFNLSIYDPTGQSTVFTTGPLTVTPNGPNAYGWDHDSNLFFFTYNSANAANLEFQLGNFGDGNSDGVRFDFDNVVIVKVVVATE